MFLFLIIRKFAYCSRIFLIYFKNGFFTYVCVHGIDKVSAFILLRLFLLGAFLSKQKYVLVLNTHSRYDKSNFVEMQVLQFVVIFFVLLICIFSINIFLSIYQLIKDQSRCFRMKRIFNFLKITIDVEVQCSQKINYNFLSRRKIDAKK